MVFLSTVEGTFQIQDRGCVIVPAVPRSNLDFRLSAKDFIQLRDSNGRVLDTFIASVELVKGEGSRMAFLLPVEIAPQDISKGMEIWLATKDPLPA